MSRSYLSASFVAVSRYFSMLPFDIVSSSLPPSRVHLPARGTRLNFALHETHLNLCLEKEWRLPIRSGMKWLIISLLAASDLSTEV